MEFGINKKLNFCIMTTANYMTKALVMYDSLVKHCKNDFSLYYFTFDKSTYDYLKKLDYKNIIPVALVELEEFYPELKSTISNRTKAEYFFTCTPHIIDYVLKKYNEGHVTYLDADLFFYNDPRIILNELGNDNSILITEHRRYKPTESDVLTGKYCVQFIPVINNSYGLKVIDWWREKCIEWCYYVCENGKFADQGYLNDWTSLFEQVKEMQHRGGGVARWNLGYYNFYKEDSRLKAFNSEINEKIDIIFYHFEGLKVLENNIMLLGLFKNEKIFFDFIYKDYVRRLSDKENELITKLKISRKDFNYGTYKHNQLRYFLSVLRRFISPKKTDMKIYYKYLNKYRWLP